MKNYPKLRIRPRVARRGALGAVGSVSVPRASRCSAVQCLWPWRSPLLPRSWPGAPCRHDRRREQTGHTSSIAPAKRLLHVLRQWERCPEREKAAPAPTPTSPADTRRIAAPHSVRRATGGAQQGKTREDKASYALLYACTCCAHPQGLQQQELHTSCFTLYNIFVPADDSP